MASYSLTEADQTHLLTIVGPNRIDNPGQFFKSMIDLANKSKWKMAELRYLNQLIRDGMGYLLQTLFRDKWHHPLYLKYYSKKEFTPAITLDQVTELAAQLKRGEITVNQLKDKFTELHDKNELNK